jgi:HSP90 family molecular chaperone
MAGCWCSLDISIEEMTLEGNKTMPILQVVDNGLGMTHEEIVRMLSFGHKRPVETDVEHIGHFGVGFKVIYKFEVFSVEMI